MVPSFCLIMAVHLLPDSFRGVLYMVPYSLCRTTLHRISRLRQLLSARRCVWTRLWHYLGAFRAAGVACLCRAPPVAKFLRTRNFGASLEHVVGNEASSLLPRALQALCLRWAFRLLPRMQTWCQHICRILPRSAPHRYDAAGDTTFQFHLPPTRWALNFPR